MIGWFLLFAGALAISAQAGSSEFSTAQRPKECVVLLHGLGRTSLSMKRLEWSAKSAGYSVVNISYPSRHQTVEQLSDGYLSELLTNQIPADATKVHFVTHSMGGILLRQYLAHHAITNMGNVVMLAPPNHGSALADKLRKRALGRWILGPGGCELGTEPTDLPQRLGAVNVPVCVIAGDVSLNPLFSRVVKEQNDGKVTVKSAKLAGMSEFVVVHSSHTWIMWRSVTVRHALHFLSRQTV